MMNFTEFLDIVDAVLQQSLSSAGFRRTSEGKWNRRNGDELHAIWVQKHSSEPMFCVNLGVHYSFLEKTGCTERPSGDEVDQTECRIMFRLTVDSSSRDQWWPLTEQGIHEMNVLLVTRGFAMLDLYRLDGPISSIDIKEIEAGIPGLLSSFTKVGAFLLLASIHEHLGHREKSIEAATCGLKHVGMKVGAKKAFKDILKRCEQKMNVK